MIDCHHPAPVSVRYVFDVVVDVQVSKMIGVQYQSPGLSFLSASFLYTLTLGLCLVMGPAVER